MTDDTMSDPRAARRNHPSNHQRRPADHRRPASASFVVSCDDCVMQCTAACADCVVTFVLRADEHGDHVDTPLVLDHDEVRAVRLLSRAGLVPDLRYELAG